MKKIKILFILIFAAALTSCIIKTQELESVPASGLQININNDHFTSETYPNIDTNTNTDTDTDTDIAAISNDIDIDIIQAEAEAINELYGFTPPAFDYFEVDGITAKIYNEEANGLKVKAVYPETVSGPVNEAVFDIVTNEIESFKAANGSKGILDIRYKAYKYGNNIVSFAIDSYEYTQEDGFAFYRKTLVFDLLGGVPININDVFSGEGYTSIINDYAKTVFSNTYSDNVDISGYDDELAISAITPTGKGGFSRYTFDDENFYIFLDLGDNDILEVPIPLKAFGDGFAMENYILRYFAYETNSGNKSQYELNNEQGQKKALEDPLTLSDPLLAGGGDTKYIAITFDDGPDKEYTPALLDILEKYNAKATFFVLGHKIDSLSDIIKRTINEGHAVGSHTYNHKQLTILQKENIEEQINLTNDLLRDYAGQETTMIRPPYGDRNELVIDIIKEKSMSIILWDVDPEDWKIFDSDKIGKHIINNVKDGDIILMHDIYKTSVEGAEIAIKELTEQGYIFVTVPELINMKCGEMITGGIYRNGNGVVNK